MGFLDKALNTGKDLLAKNADKVDKVIDKAGDVVDKRTHGKYAGTVNKVQSVVKDSAKKAASSGPTPPTYQPPTYPPAANTPPSTPPTPPAPPVPPTPPAPPVPPS
ncbi:MAG: antitoxin [Mycobacterium sp.]